MHAAVSLAPDRPLVWTELEPQPLATRDVRVAVRAVGVNPVDWKMREGGPLRMVQRMTGPAGALVVGVDVAGEVVEVGHQVQGLQPGDRVVGSADFSRGQRGSYATEVLVRADQLVKLPDSIDWEVAGGLPVAGVTALLSLRELGGIDRLPGAKVLVLGASGGVGHMAVQVARLLGGQAFGVCSSRNAALVASLGSEVLAYDQPDFGAQLAKAGPFQVVLDAVGTTAYPVRQARQWLAPGGRHVLVVPQPSDLPWLLTRSTTTVLGNSSAERLAPLVDWLAQGKLTVHVGQTLPLQDAEQAHVLSRQGRTVGKLVLLA